MSLWARDPAPIESGARLTLGGGGPKPEAATEALGAAGTLGAPPLAMKLRWKPGYPDALLRGSSGPLPTLLSLYPVAVLDLNQPSSPSSSASSSPSSGQPSGQQQQEAEEEENRGRLTPNFVPEVPAEPEPHKLQCCSSSAPLPSLYDAPASASSDPFAAPLFATGLFLGGALQHGDARSGTRGDTHGDKRLMERAAAHDGGARKMRLITAAEATAELTGSGSSGSGDFGSGSGAAPVEQSARDGAAGGVGSAEGSMGRALPRHCVRHGTYQGVVAELARGEQPRGVGNPVVGAW